MKTTKEQRYRFVNAGSEIEHELLSIFKPEANIVIADIGACDGLSTVIYSKIFPNAKFYCFEPVRENCNELYNNIFEYRINDRVTVYQVALGNKKEEAKFFRSEGQAPGVKDWETGNKSSSLMKPKLHLKAHPWCSFSKSEIVNVDLLDNFRISHIDFAHIDVQGAEMLVLLGGKETFKTTKAIWIEVANIELYANQPRKNEISFYLNGRGYRCIKDTCGKGKAGDMLWVKR